MGDFSLAQRLLILATVGDESRITGTWMIPMAYFEAAVTVMLEVQELEDKSPLDENLKLRWTNAMNDANTYLDSASAKLGDTDLSSRLESRIAMVWVERRP